MTLDQEEHDFINEVCAEDASRRLAPRLSDDPAVRLAECQSCNGKGSVCIDWDAGEWMDCPQCKEPADAGGYPDDAPGTTYDDAPAAKGGE